MQTTIKFKDFDNGYWDAFAGATKFDSGHEPVTGESKQGRTVVADATGIQVLENPDIKDLWWTLDLSNCNEAVIKAVANTLPYDLTDKALEIFGFELQ